MRCTPKFDKIEFSDLPPRLVQILLREGFVSLSQLAIMRDAEILLIRNVGHDYLREIRACLKRS